MFVSLRRIKLALFLSVLTVMGSFFLFSSSSMAQDASSVTERRAALEKDLANLEAQIDAQRVIITQKEKESVSLQRDIDILNAKIKSSELSIRARALAIAKLADEISGKAVMIDRLDAKTVREQGSLGRLVRQIQELDSKSLAEVVLNGRKFSKFFEDLGPFFSIKEAISKSLIDIRDNKAKTQAEKDSLEEKKTEQVELQTLQELEKRRITQEQLKKKQIFTVSKGIESLYKKMLTNNEQSAAKIRAELFTLRGSAAIPFEKALALANAASKKTGVRSALILGIIAEESNLGENVGTGNWRVDMKSPRDTEPFLAITASLGLNPDQVPVSKKPWYGYGGAMGPAQFIPSTWVGLSDRIANATGHRPPNPWDPEDAFMAAALYLMDAGADKSTPTAERLAALRYLAGWTNATKRAYAFYGDDVMDLSAKYQRQIDILNAG